MEKKDETESENVKKLRSKPASPTINPVPDSRRSEREKKSAEKLGGKE
jgi:hypothetical protein